MAERAPLFSAIPIALRQAEAGNRFYLEVFLTEANIKQMMEELFALTADIKVLIAVGNPLSKADAWLSLGNMPLVVAELRKADMAVAPYLPE